MVRVPASWQLTNIAEISELVSDGDHNPPKRVAQGIPHLTAKHIKNSAILFNDCTYISQNDWDRGKKRYQPNPGDVIITCVGTIGETAIVPPDCPVFSPDRNLAAVRAINWAMEPMFLQLWLKSREARVRMEDGSGSTAQPHLYLSAIRTLPCPLPPLNEQRRIVARIEELTARSKSAKESLQAIPPLLEKFRQSVLAAAFRGDLTAEWRRQNPDVESAVVLLERIRVERRRRWEDSGARGKYVDPEPVDASGLPELPSEWCWAKMENLVDGTPQNGLYLPQSAYGEGYPILRVEDYQVDWVRDRSSLKLATLEPGEARKFLLEAGDLLINRVNSPSHLGKALAATTDLAGSLFESNLMRLKLMPTLSVEWGCYYLESSGGRKRLTQHAKWAVNQASINQQDVLGTPIPLCCGREQGEIVRLLSIAALAIQNFRDILRSSSTSRERLDSSILSKAFRGELVPQDPNDEPALSLLQRIRTQKLDQAPKTRRKTLVGGDR